MKKFLYHGKKNICGDRIRMARLGKRLSQTDLARLLQLEGVPMERDVISRIRDCISKRTRTALSGTLSALRRSPGASRRPA